MFDRKDFTIPKIHEKPPIERLTVSCNSDPLSKKILKLDIQNFQLQTYSGINGVNIDTNEYGSVQIIQKLAETKVARTTSVMFNMIRGILVSSGRGERQ